MSLLDALLLDPVELKSPETPPRREIWIALRGDQAGSGTLEDPYDGSKVQEFPQNITQITRLTTTAPDNTIAVVSCPAHGFRVGDVVTISGVPAGLEPFAGVFRIFSLTTDTFRYKMQTAPTGDATGAGISCFRTIYRFDELMRSLPYLDANPSALPGLGKLPPRCTIHLGPGIFETTGFVWQTAESSSNLLPFGWLAQSGQRFLGSGIDVTVLKLVNVTDPLFNTVAIRGTDEIGFSAVLDGFEACDFTIDCNLAGQPVPAGFAFAPVCCGGIALWGNHVRLRRIRCINWGTQAPPECFVLTVLFPTQNPDQCVDNVIEDCIVEQPSINNNHESTLIGIASGDPSTVGGSASQNVPRPAGFSRACVARQCCVNCESATDPVPIGSLTYDVSGGNTLVTVTTVTPHHRSASQWVIISGVENQNGIFNPFNGSFKVEPSPVPTATTFVYKVSGVQSPYPNTLTGRMFVDRWSSMAVQIASLAQHETNPRWVRLTTPAGHPHFRRPGNNVVVQDTESDEYEALYRTERGKVRLPVVDVVSPTELIYELPTSPTGPPNPVPPSARIGVEFNGAYADLVERCTAINCFNGVYRDTHSLRYQIIRHNYFRDIFRGVIMNLVQAGIGPFAVSSLAPVAGSDGRLAQLIPAVAGFENFKLKTAASVPHAVRVSGASVGSSGQGNSYNSLVDDTAQRRYQEVLASDSTALVYELSPSVTEIPTGAITFDKIFQMGFIVVSKNVFEAVHSYAIAGAAPGMISSVALAGRGLDNPYTIRKLVVVENLIRQVDDGPEPNTRGVAVDRVESAWLGHNHLGIARTPGMSLFNSRAAVDIGNFAADGLPAKPERTNTKEQIFTATPELYEELDDALSVAL